MPVSLPIIKPNAVKRKAVFFLNEAQDRLFRAETTNRVQG